MIPQKGQQQSRLYYRGVLDPAYGSSGISFPGYGGVDSTVGPTGDRTTESGAKIHADDHFWSQASYRHASNMGQHGDGGHSGSFIPFHCRRMGTEGHSGYQMSGNPCSPEPSYWMVGGQWADDLSPAEMPRPPFASTADGGSRLGDWSYRAGPVRMGGQVGPVGLCRN